MLGDKVVDVGFDFLVAVLLLSFDTRNKWNELHAAEK